ncbi:hypothetical protein BGZ83_000968, partial [Gryganskiella cystojenkinii]
MATETLKFKYVQSCLVSGDLSKVRHFPAPPTRPCPDLPATPSSVSSVCSSPSPSSSFAASSSSSTPSPFSFSSSSPFSVAAFSSSHSPPSSRERNKQNGPEMPPHSGNSNRSSTSPKLQKFQAYSHTGQPGVIYTLEAEWDEVSGKYAIDLRDIEYTFQSDINGHILIKNGEVVVKFLNDKANKRRRLKPLRIAYHDNVLLQVVPVGGQHLDPAVNSSSSSSSSPAGTPRTTRTIETQTSQATLFRMSVVSQTRQSRTLLKGISEKVNLISSDIRANHIEVMDLLNENTDRILAQSDNLFRLTRGLHESPIPSHFVVLPCPISFKDRLNPFVVKYRLYFLCDCDVSPHAATSGQRLPHVHFAKHEGYDMVRPTEFFRKYGPYVLTMLKLLWVSVELGSAAIPNVPGVNEPLQRVIDAAINGGKNLLQSQIKFAIDYLERLPEDERLDQTGNDLSVKKYNYHLDKIKALEGADLRHLVSFLKNRDPDQTLGNLYRLARPDGTVHWVCLEHYHPNYKAEEQKTFTEFVRRNKGFFDSNKGKVEIRIGSRDMATKFYELLVNAKFVQELVIVMAWKTSLTDFLALQETITPLTTIMSLTVDCCHTQSSLKNMVCSMIDGTPATILAEIMAGPSRQVFVIKNHNSFLSQVWRFPSNINLQTIDLGSCIKGENLKENLKTLVKKTPFLKHLILKVHSIHTVPILFADPKSYRFKSDVAVLEVHLETGEIITGSIQAGKFIEVTLTAMDCSKNFTMLPFVTKMITKIAANTSLRQLSRFVRKNTALKDVEIEVAANMFFQIHQLLAEASRGIRSAVFHDELDNTLRMSDIRDSSTADVVLRDDSVDFERLLGAFKAVPRRCGFIFAVNDLMAELFERRTKAGSPITSLKIDLSALSVDGLSKLFIVIQRSQLQELHLTHTGGANSNSTDTPDLTSDSLLLAFLQKTVPFLKGTHLQLPCRADQIYSYGVTIIKLFTAKSGCQLTLSDGTNSVLLDDVHDTKKAKVSVSTDNIGVSLNEFFVLFGSIPSTIGVSIEVTDSIVEFLDDVSASPTMVDIPLRSISVNPMTLSEVDLQGKRGVYYFDPQGKLVDEWDDLGEVLVSLGTNLVKLDTESFVFLDEHAVQLNQTMAQESRLASLRLAPSHLSKTGLDAMQAIIDRSHVLTSFTFVCGSDHAHMASNEALEMLVRNRKRITELVLQGSEIRFWLQQLSHRFHKRAFLPALSALKIISDGDTLGGELQEWIANLVRDVEGFRSLTSVHLRNANLSPRGWEMFFRELTSASLEELDLSNSDVSQSLITEWIQELGSEAASRFRRLNLQGTFITPSDLMIVIAALESRSVNARLDGAPTVAHEQQDFGTLSVSSRGNDDAFANTDHAIDSTNNPKTGFATTPLPSTSVDPKRRQRQYSLKKGLSLIIQHPAVNGLPRPYVPPPPRSPQFSSQDLHPPTSVHMPPAVVVPLARSSSLLGSPLSHIRKLGRRGLQRRSGGGAGGFGDSDHADIDDDDDCKKDESDGTENGSSTRSPERCQSPRSPQMLYPTALVMQNELMPSSMRTISLTGTSAMV